MDRLRILGTIRMRFVLSALAQLLLTGRVRSDTVA